MNDLDQLIQKREFSGDFRDFEYRRPDMDAIKKSMTACIRTIETAQTYAEAREAFQRYQDLDEWVFTLATCVFVRRMMDTADTFYAEEMSYFDRDDAGLGALRGRYSDAVLSSPFRAQFEQDYGPMLTVRMEGYLKIHTDAVADEWAEYNCISSEYQGIIAQCHTVFQGEDANFYRLLKGMEDTDRAVRREAFEKWAALYEQCAPKLEALFLRLVRNMNQLARKLGYENYEPVAYIQLNRYGYTSAEMAAFCRQVQQVVVPICMKLRDRQAKELGVDELTFYDEPLLYKDGNPVPVGTTEEKLEQVRQAFHKVHPLAGSFYDLVCEHHLYDLDSRVGKTVGGYCRWMPTFRAPFIFSNFNNTVYDADVMTHEGGHGFAASTYSRLGKNPIDALRFAPGETHEIQSTTMEYFAAPYLDGLFGGKEGGDRYRYMHMVKGLFNLCYECALEQFQVQAFRTEDLDAQKLRAIWRQAEQQYMPWRDYDGNEFLQSGGFWMQKMHLFQMPFYYIQYALANVNALELYGRWKTEPQKAWDDYFRFCHLGCTQSYADTLRAAGVHAPYEDGTVAAVMDRIRPELDI